MNNGKNYNEWNRLIIESNGEIGMTGHLHQLILGPVIGPVLLLY